MGVLDSILTSKPLTAWQKAVREQGRSCESCGAAAMVSAPVSNEGKAVRISCPSCGHISYEFQPEVIYLTDLKRGQD